MKDKLENLGLVESKDAAAIQGAQGIAANEDISSSGFKPMTSSNCHGF